MVDLKSIIKTLQPLILLNFMLAMPLPVWAQDYGSASTKDLKILHLIGALPEVKAQNNKVKSASNGKYQVMLVVSGTPTYDIPYYQVNVSAGAPSYDILYQFAVDPKTYQIFYYDAGTNKQYLLPEWRKRRKQ